LDAKTTSWLCALFNNKKLIMRWDGERELSLRRHCTRTKNTIDSCITSATDRFLQRRFTKFNGITQCNGHYAVQGHSRSPILVPIESWYTTSYYWLILTYRLSCTVSKLWLIIGQIFANESGVSHFIALPEVTLANIAINDISLKTIFIGLHFRRIKYWCIFNHFYVIRSKSYGIPWNFWADRAITALKVIQGHRFWYQSKAHIRLPISD